MSGQVKGGIEISKELRWSLTRRRWGSLWGQRRMVKPYLVEAILGDGMQLLAVTPLNTRPQYYLIRVDSKWSSRHTDDANCIAEHIDEICEAIEDEVGPVHDSESSDKRQPWPAIDDECGVSWCNSDDLLPAPPIPSAKESEA